MTGGEAREATEGFCVCWSIVEPARDCGIASHRKRGRSLARQTSAAPSRASLEALATEWERKAEYCQRKATAYPDLGDSLLGEAAGARNAAERLRALLAEQTGDEQ